MILIQSIIFQDKKGFIKFLKSGCRKQTKIFVSRELDLNGISDIDNSPHVVKIS